MLSIVRSVPFPHEHTSTRADRIQYPYAVTGEEPLPGGSRGTVPWQASDDGPAKATAGQLVPLLLDLSALPCASISRSRHG